jgi:hypothetical protein
MEPYSLKCKCRTSLLTLIVAVATIGFAEPGLAQVTPASSGLQQLQIPTEVRIVFRGHERFGLARVAGDSILLQTPDGIDRIAVLDVEKVYVKAANVKKGAIKGALYGASVGLVAGELYARAVRDRAATKHIPGAFIGVTVGAGIGALLGVMSGQSDTSWKQIFP